MPIRKEEERQRVTEKEGGRGIKGERERKKERENDRERGRDKERKRGLEKGREREKALLYTPAQRFLSQVTLEPLASLGLTVLLCPLSNIYSWLTFNISCFTSACAILPSKA